MDKDFQEELEIDVYNLEEEIKNQPLLFFKYSELLAKADRKAKIAKEKVEYEEALADKFIRQTSTSKMTESAIKNSITTDLNVMEAHNQLIEAIYEKNMLDAAVKAFEQRKNSLDNLVKLYIQQYFSEPTERVMAKAVEQEKKRDDFRAIVKAKLNRKE